MSNNNYRYLKNISVSEYKKRVTPRNIEDLYDDVAENNLSRKLLNVGQKYRMDKRTNSGAV